MKSTKILFDEAGGKVGILMGAKEFEKLMSKLEDLSDIHAVYKAKNSKSKPIPYETIREKLFGNVARK